MSAALPPHLRATAEKAFLAIQSDDVATLARMLKEGMHPDLKLGGPGMNKRALVWAVGRENPAVFDLYLRHGGSINLPVVAANDPLFLSVSREDTRGVIRALTAGADVASKNDPGKDRNNVLHVAAQGGNPEIMRLLLDAGGWHVLEERNARNNTPEEESRKHARSGQGGKQHKRVQEMMAEYSALPRLDFARGGFTKAALFQTDAEGRCPLNHPETWQRWEEVCAVLSENGEQVSKQELLQTGADGESWLARAASCFAAEKVMAQLNRQGEQLMPEDLLEGKNQPSPLLQTLRKHRQTGAVLAASNCRTWGVNGLEAVVHQLDAYEKHTHVPHYFQLRHIVQQEEVQQLQGGKGR